MQQLLAGIARATRYLTVGRSSWIQTNTPFPGTCRRDVCESSCHYVLSVLKLPLLDRSFVLPSDLPFALLNGCHASQSIAHSTSSPCAARRSAEI